MPESHQFTPLGHEHRFKATYISQGSREETTPNPCPDALQMNEHRAKLKAKKSKREGNRTTRLQTLGCGTCFKFLIGNTPVCAQLPQKPGVTHQLWGHRDGEGRPSPRDLTAKPLSAPQPPQPAGRGLCGLCTDTLSPTAPVHHQSCHGRESRVKGCPATSTPAIPFNEILSVSVISTMHMTLLI